MNSRSLSLALTLLCVAQIWAAKGNDYEYSADGKDDEVDDYWDERDNDGDKEGSAFGPDDEDTEGSGPDGMSPCQKLRDELNGKKLIGAYIPKCTLFGEFLPKQCHGSTGECWCVNRVGQQIPGTMRRAPEEPSCDDIDRDTEIPQPPGPNRPGDNKPMYPEEPETDRPGQPTDPDVVIDSPSPDNGDKFDKGSDGSIEIINNNGEEDDTETRESVYNQKVSRSSIIEQPGILAGIIGGAVVGLLCAVLLVMFIVYRMRKKDEGSYALDEPKRHVSPSITYSRARDKEFFA